jgi:hypothetical protein
MTSTTHVQPDPSPAPTVMVRKARGSAGVNHSLGRFVQVGDEIDVTVEMAAQCIIGKEFDLVEESDRPCVDAAIRALCDDPAQASTTPTVPGITTPLTPETTTEPESVAPSQPEPPIDPASDPNLHLDADTPSDHPAAATDPIDVYSDNADAPGDGTDLAPDPTDRRSSR